MRAIELLQQIGLNKYEAEAYYTLLAEGPLTGYELGKRSQVPLSRSYEILERLTQKGLALVQPGDPPRYLAASPDQFLGQVRGTVLERLDTLASVLATLPQPDGSSGDVGRARPQRVEHIPVVRRQCDRARRAFLLVLLDLLDARDAQAFRVRNLDDGIEQVPDHAMARAGDADLLPRPNQRARHVRPGECLARARRSLDRQHRLLKGHGQPLRAIERRFVRKAPRSPRRQSRRHIQQ